MNRGVYTRGDRGSGRETEGFTPQETEVLVQEVHARHEVIFGDRQQAFSFLQR